MLPQPGSLHAKSSELQSIQKFWAQTAKHHLNCFRRIDDEEHWAKEAFNRTKMTSKRKSKTYFFSEVEEETATHLFPGTEKNYLKQEKLRLCRIFRNLLEPKTEKAFPLKLSLFLRRHGEWTRAILLLLS